MEGGVSWRVLLLFDGCWTGMLVDGWLHASHDGPGRRGGGS